MQPSADTIISTVLIKNAVNTPTPSIDAMNVYSMGRQMSKAEAELLQSLFDTTRDNLSAAMALLGYYEKLHVKDKKCAERYANMIIWAIRAIPSSFILSHVRYGKRDNNYKKIKDCWLAKLQEQPTNAIFLDNAAEFCASLDKAEAVEFWQRAMKSDPLNRIRKEKLESLVSK